MYGEVHSNYFKIWAHTEENRYKELVKIRGVLEVRTVESRKHEYKM